MNVRRRFLIGAGLCLALFVVVAILVSTGRTAQVDQAVLGSLRLAGQPHYPSFPGWILDVCNVVSPWGTWSDRLVLALACGVALLTKQRGREAGVIMISVVIAALLNPIVKNIVDRARPDIIWRLAKVDDAAFPSAHAMGAMVLYPMAGFMIGRLARGLRGGWIGFAGGIVLALAIGATRVLLGVHWLTDVIGGWLIGLGWACASLALVVRGGRKQRAGSIEDRIAPGAAVGQRGRHSDARR